MESQKPQSEEEELMSRVSNVANREAGSPKAIVYRKGVLSSHDRGRGHMNTYKSKKAKIETLPPFPVRSPSPRINPWHRKSSAVVSSLCSAIPKPIKPRAPSLRKFWYNLDHGHHIHNSLCCCTHHTHHRYALSTRKHASFFPRFSLPSAPPSI